jgi:hypothetical protein
MGAVAPAEDSDFLYSPGAEFAGEAGLLLRAVGISFAGKPAEAVHAEFQGAGFFLTHLLECPLESGHQIEDDATFVIREHLPSVASRIRRSLKPKRVMLVTEVQETILEDVLALDLGCPVVLDEGKPFTFSSLAKEASFSRFRELLSVAGRN